MLSHGFCGSEVLYVLCPGSHKAEIKVSGTGSLFGRSEKEFDLKFIQVASRIQFLVTIGLRALLAVSKHPE